jgi:DNA (cytosine-5)-methyltransferase 1
VLEGFGLQRASADTQHGSLQDDGIVREGVGEEDCGWASGGSQYGDLSKDWFDFPTVSPVCRGDDGISEVLYGITFPRWRKESIKVYGNAIVPQLAYRLFRVIEFMSTGR